MRIIFLNTWYGHAGKPFFDFIDSEALKADIFCLMEVTPDLYLDLSKRLSGFSSIYQIGRLSKNLGVVLGQAIFLGSGIKILDSGKVSIYRQSDHDVGLMQYAEVEVDKQKLWLGDVHGKTLPGDKHDTPVRIKQSQKIIDFFKNYDDPKIIGGDFNLLPETKSIKIFEESGYRNLIKEYGIKATRNQISWSQFESQPGYTKQYFADFAFVSPHVKVKNFEVPNVEVSDHLPLILDFEI